MRFRRNMLGFLSEAGHPYHVRTVHPGGITRSPDISSIHPPPPLQICPGCMGSPDLLRTYGSVAAGGREGSGGNGDNNVPPGMPLRGTESPRAAADASFVFAFGHLTTGSRGPLVLTSHGPLQLHTSNCSGFTSLTLFMRQCHVTMSAAWQPRYSSTPTVGKT